MSPSVVFFSKKKNFFKSFFYDFYFTKIELFFYVGYFPEAIRQMGCF